MIKGSPPGQKDIVDFLVLPDVIQPFADVLGHFVIFVHEQPFAETKPAIGGAHFVDQ